MKGMFRRNPVPRSAGALALAAAAVMAVFGNATVASAQIGHVKMTLPKSISPSPVFLVPGICGNDVPNGTATCNATIIKAIDFARKTEPLYAIPPSFSLAAFDKLTGPEQIFAIANIERTARGLPPILATTVQLDAMAESGATQQGDPSVKLPLRLTHGGLATAYGSNFAEGTANAMGADYYWMYDDGLNSPNTECTTHNTKACWGHRENVLFNYANTAYCPRGSKPTMYMGTAEVTSHVKWSPSITEIFVNDCGAMPSDRNFTWPDVQKLVFGH